MDSQAKKPIDGSNVEADAISTVLEAVIACGGFLTLHLKLQAHMHSGCLS